MGRTLEDDAKPLRIAIEAVPVSGADRIDAAVATVAGEPGSGLIVLPDGFTVTFRTDIIAAAARHKVPAIYPYTFFVQEDGLVSYGIDVADLFRNAAGYIDRILKGAKPADLPVQAPTSSVNCRRVQDVICGGSRRRSRRPWAWATRSPRLRWRGVLGAW
jgi:putative ABC transport system substrate-binding protein